MGERHRWHAVRGHLHELGGDLPAAAKAYAEAARRATNVAERDHLVRQAARARAGGVPGQAHPARPDAADHRLREPTPESSSRTRNGPDEPGDSGGVS